MPIVKICGLTNLVDAQVAVNAGADLLGFIFYPKSPRYVVPEIVGEIVAALKQEMRPPGEESSPRSARPVHFVGVFVNEPLPSVQAILQQADLDFAQLHGDETIEMLKTLDQQAYKALRPADAAQAQAEAEFWHNQRCAGPALMVDAYDPDEYGGTGKKADWPVAAALARNYLRFLLAGGLTADNVGAAIAAVQPWGVDVASGVEATPGKKDHTQVRRFIRNAKQ